MGITISSTLMQTTERVKETLDHGEYVAKIFQKQAKSLSIPFKIRRESDHNLYIDIGGCETLAFNFQRHAETWPENYMNEYGGELLPFDQSPESSDHYQSWPGQISLWSSDFCKTQYGDGIICHVWVAEITRAISSMCKLAKVYDEGDYFHTRNTRDAFKAIGENQKMIDGLLGTFQSLGYEVITPKIG